MGKKIFYIYFTDIEGMEIVKSLHDEFGWLPKVICGDDGIKNKNWLKKNNFDSLLINSMFMRQAKFEYLPKIESLYSNIKLFNFAAKYFSQFLGILHDTNGWNFSFEERKAFFYEVLSYWNDVIMNCKPDFIMFRTSPHLASCFSLYVVAKFYNIKIGYIDFYPQFNQKKHFINSSLEVQSLEIDREMKKNNNLPTSKVVNNYLREIKNQYFSKKKYENHVFNSKEKISSPLPAHVKRDISRFKNLNNLNYFFLIFSNINNMILNFFRIFLQNLNIKNIKNIKSINKLKFFFIKKFLKNIYGFELKKNKKDYNSIRSRLNIFDEIIFRYNISKKNISIGNVYEKLCVKPDTKENYILFPAPYQPEATTVPNASYLENIFIVLEILLSSMPSNWKIYYKEHYSQFWSKFKGSLMRDKYFYGRIKKYTKIKIISTKEDQQELIKKSKAVALIGGTSGVEAIVNNIPVLNFAPIWYQGCDGVINVKNKTDCLEAFEKINNGFKPSIEKISKYLSTIEKISFKNEFSYSLRPNEKSITNEDLKLIVKKISQANY